MGHTDLSVLKANLNSSSWKVICLATHLYTRVALFILIDQSTCTSMCRHVYDCNIVECDVNQQISSSSDRIDFVHKTQSVFCLVYALFVIRIAIYLYLTSSKETHKS